MAWMFLLTAIALEVAGTFLLKLSDGFEKLHWGMASILSCVVCFWVLAYALKLLPVGVVYAIWAGAGIAAATLLGLFIFNEKLEPMQFAFIAMIFVGAIGLQLTTQQLH